nr:unnamed protein product [Digitaria exilis]CAB3479756.1 unnamed protein product [Digitaria exilis]
MNYYVRDNGIHLSANRYPNLALMVVAIVPPAAAERRGPEALVSSAPQPHPHPRRRTHQTPPPAAAARHRVALAASQRVHPSPSCQQGG